MTPIEKRILKLETSPRRTAPRFVVVRTSYSDGFVSVRLSDTVLGVSETLDPYASDTDINRLVADRARPQ